jgi:NodT family efflux transporter outer membrane factor (OMF) lipoprotein
LASNPTLEGAAASLQQARALRDVAEAGLWPQGQGTGSARRSTQGIAVSNRAASTLVSLGIEETWTLDVFGGRRSALAAQQAAVWSRMANLGDYRVQIAAELATTYINLRAAQARLALAQQTLSSQSHTRQLVGWRRQAGLVSALDSDQADFAFASTQASLPALQNAITQSSHALSILTGRPPRELVGLLQEVRAVPTVEANLVLTLPAETLRQRADVRAGEFAILEALGRLGQAEAATKPSFTLGGSIGLSAAGLGTVLNGSSLLTALSAGVQVPFGPGPAAQVRADQAGVELAKHAYRGTVLAALRDVEDALARLRDDQAILASLNVASAAANKAYDLAQIRYRSGLIDFQTVLDTERAAFSGRDGLVTARGNLSQDSIALYKALGGGWNTDLQEQL